MLSRREKFITVQRFIIKCARLSTVATLFVAHTTKAADLAQFNTLDSSASMLTTPAKSISPSEAHYSLGIIHSSKFQVHQATDTSHLSNEELSSIKKSKNTASNLQFGAGFAVNDRFQIDLGIGFESEVFAERDKLLGPNLADSEKTKFKPSGLSGFSLMTKLNLFTGESHSFSLAPFLETAAPAASQDSLLRARTSRLGGLALYSYQNDDIFFADFNFGARNHSNEKFGSAKIGLETFSSVELRVPASDSISLMAGARSRKLEVKILDTTRKLNSSDFQIGLGLHSKNIETSLFVGSTLAKDSFASAREIVGMRVSYTVKGPEADTNQVAEASPTVKRKGKSAKKSKKAESDPIENESDLMSADYDMFQAIEKNDLNDTTSNNDFRTIKSNLSSEKTKTSDSEANIQEIDEELAKIREAEEKIRVQQTEQARRDEELQMKMLKQEIEENKVLEEKYLKDIKRNEEFPEFENDSVNWDGLRNQNEGSVEGGIDSSDIEAVHID
jgi:hypothetical protein